MVGCHDCGLFVLSYSHNVSKLLNNGTLFTWFIAFMIVGVNKCCNIWMRLVVCSFPVNTVICNGQTEGRSFFLPLSLQVIAKTNEHIEARLVTLYFKMSSSLKYRYTVSFICSQCTKRRGI